MVQAVSRLGLGLLFGLGLVLGWGLLGGVGCEKKGVIPPELKKLGSIRSATYTARHLYPERTVELAIMRPRLGDPRLLAATADTLTVAFYRGPFLPDTPETLYLREARESGPATYVLQPLAMPMCDADSICVVDAVLDGDTPADVLLDICLQIEDLETCAVKAFYRFGTIPNPLSLAVIADPHLGGAEPDGIIETRLENLLAEINAQPAIHLVVLVGDLGDEGRRGQLRSFVARAAQSQKPVLTVPGNHDYKEGNIKEYLFYVTPHLDHVTRIGPYTLIGLNSGPARWDEEPMTARNEGVGLEEGQIEWLETALGEASGAKIVYLHHPPYSFTWSVIGRRRKAFLRACRNGGVPLILAGHTHLNEIYDRYGIPYDLDVSRGATPASQRLPLTLITARSTDRGGGYRQVDCFADGTFKYQWQPVGFD
jgi:predicted phosphodiesterase